MTRRNPNHPKKGASIKVHPIRSLEAIAHIKAQLQDQPRNLCLFTMGINTAYRANEMLSLTVGQVAHLQIGDVLDVRQSKNSEYRMAALNGVTVSAIQNWLQHHPQRDVPGAPLFMSQHWRKQALTVSAVNLLMKSWCSQAGLSGNFGSHSLRKTWGYHQRVKHNSSVALLMSAYGHASEAQTLDYLGILVEEIQAIYMMMEL
jgi:integrase